MAVLAPYNYQAFEYLHSDNAQIFYPYFWIFMSIFVIKNHELTPKYYSVLQPY